MNKTTPLISTLEDRCRLCYTCVRDCPAKAIRISDGQAKVLIERCIGCGNCVRVCSQGAKKWYNSISEVEAIFAGSGTRAAIVAPSFAADFPDIGYREFVGKLRALGFDEVYQVAFGADLVAERYRRLLEASQDSRFIAATCPAIVAYVRKYHPDSVGMLAPVVSPMVAMARVVKSMRGADAKVVFIGPCLAKKVEAVGDNGHRDVDAVLTFNELSSMFLEGAERLAGAIPSDFDPPHPGKGVIFPVRGGMLQAAELKEDLLLGEVVVADGKNDFALAIREFESGDLDAKLLEILCCNGCIMGSGMRTDKPRFFRRSAISRYARLSRKKFDPEAWRRDLERFSKLDLSATFEPDDNRLAPPLDDDISQILARMGKNSPEDELDCGACGYSTCRDHAAAVLKGMAESEMCLPHTIERLKDSLNALKVSSERLASTQSDLNQSYEQLASTQQALFNAEKLASMGQLSAGIAHEINNPLGVILLFANNLLEEFQSNSDNYEDVKMIAEQAERCKKIVSGLLNFARKNKVVLQETNIKSLVGACLKAIIAPENIAIKVLPGGEELVVEVDPDQMIQVLTNLVRNAIEAMPNGGNITIGVSSDAENFEIAVADNGPGVTRENLGKIFEPLFTTKQIGKGTGLGLAVIYGIVKMHHGDISVESNAESARGPTGTKFAIKMPLRTRQNLNPEINTVNQSNMENPLL